tara:strand:+ start:128 stop:244 length:117 start_codon:yes stop_codon:yes gene_type:complete
MYVYRGVKYTPVKEDKLPAKEKTQYYRGIKYTENKKDK